MEDMHGLDLSDDSDEAAPIAAAAAVPEEQVRGGGAGAQRVRVARACKEALKRHRDMSARNENEDDKIWVGDTEMSYADVESSVWHRKGTISDASLNDMQGKNGAAQRTLQRSRRHVLVQYICQRREKLNNLLAVWLPWALTCASLRIKWDETRQTLGAESVVQVIEIMVVFFLNKNKNKNKHKKN